jgi:hypothetical protein
MKQFSEISHEEARLEGEKVRLDEILDQDIIILGFTTAQSKFSKNKSGLYATVQFSITEDEKRVFFTGSDVIIDQLQRYRNEMPFSTKIKKVNKYYTFS